MVVRVGQCLNDVFKDSRLFASFYSSIFLVFWLMESLRLIASCWQCGCCSPRHHACVRQGRKEDIFLQLPLSVEESSRRSPWRLPLQFHWVELIS